MGYVPPPPPRPKEDLSAIGYSKCPNCGASALSKSRIGFRLVCEYCGSSLRAIDHEGLPFWMDRITK